MFIDFEKYRDRLVPAIVQDDATNKVLMLGFMDAEALEQTKTTGKVTFFSRSRREIWVKGETSGYHFQLREILLDCDNDTLLIKAIPAGPACHTGTDTCFGEKNTSDNFLVELEKTVRDRRDSPLENSYTSKLFAAGINNIAQKVGEEAVELVIEAKDANISRFVNEAADLFFHTLILLVEKDVELSDVLDILRQRSEMNSPSVRS